MHSPHVRNNELVALGRQSLHLREKHFAVISRSLGSAFAVQIDDLVENDWWRLKCQSVSSLNRLGEIGSYHCLALHRRLPIHTFLHND